MEAEALNQYELGTIRGKVMAGKTERNDMLALLEHIEVCEGLLNDGDQDDAFGTEGWRHRAGID